MATTTIRLPIELKTRVTEAARRSGTTTHGFILAAIAEKTDAELRRAEFEQVAEARYSGIVASDRAIPWGEMRRYMQARVAGKKAKKPAARVLSRKQMTRIEVAGEVAANTRGLGSSKVMKDLAKTGLAAKERERQHFFDLAERLARSKSTREQKRLKSELARVVFGDKGPPVQM